MYVITTKMYDVETRFVIGCLNMAKEINNRLKQCGIEVVSFITTNVLPERSEIEKRRAADITYMLFSETETEQ